MRCTCLVLALLMLASCGEDGSPGDGTPAEATALAGYVETGVDVVVPRLGGFEALLPGLLSPGSPGSEDFSFTPTPGGPANSYDFAVPYDGNGDGLNETTIAGSAAFNGPADNVGPGFGGAVSFTMETVGGLGHFNGSMNFMLTAAGREFSGSGTFDESVTGRTTTVQIDPSTPMRMTAATGSSGAVANACGYSLNGSIDVAVSGSRGSLTSTWGFSPSRAEAAVTNRVFTSTGGEVTNLPDTDVLIECGSTGSLNDWNGTYIQRWACFPPEFGSARLTLAVTGPATVEITDEDPPGSRDVQVYSAASVPGNPHVLRGYFIAGPSGSQYREDFTWTLVANGHRFSQISYYTYQEGPNAGTGGLCGGAASRE